MRWHTWVLAPLLTAFLGLFAAGTLAALLVDWYNVSSFEGGSGFFVVFIALFGWVAGLIVGLIAAVVVARRPAPGFLKAVGYGWGASLAIVLVIGAGARFLADIPPELRGDELHLQVELRYPPGAPRPENVQGGRLRLHSATASSVRKTKTGPLWFEDAREEDGRWIVPGAVHVFTQRGRRMLDIGIGDTQLAGFVVPLPGHPRTEHEAWSEWLPKDQPGVEPARGGLTYRFRVVRNSGPIRTVQAGPFEIGVVASEFFMTSGTEEMAARSLFRIAHKGQPFERPEIIDYVGIIGGQDPVLFVRALDHSGVSTCRFLVSTGDSIQARGAEPCLESEDIAPVTNDQTLFARARERKALPGYPDRLTFQVPGLYQVGEMVVDTRTRTMRRFTRPNDPYAVSGVPPLALSPDERSLVLLAQDSESRHFLAVADTYDQRAYTLPIDRARMRFFSDQALGPDWVRHHFEWTKSPSGHDILTERASFDVLPYQGEFQDESYAPGYNVGPGKEPLRDAVASILVTELGAEPMPDGNYGFDKRVRLDGKVISITLIESGPYVYVAYEGSGGDVAFMRSVAARLDAAFATRKWDAAFGAR
jgi:hypothetical protein